MHHVPMAGPAVPVATIPPTEVRAETGYSGSARAMADVQKVAGSPASAIRPPKALILRGVLTKQLGAHVIAEGTDDAKSKLNQPAIRCIGSAEESKPAMKQDAKQFQPDHQAPSALRQGRMARADPSCMPGATIMQMQVKHPMTILTRRQQMPAAKEHTRQEV